MSADCPTAAAACFSGIERGRPPQPEPRRPGGDRARGHERDLDARSPSRAAISAASGSMRARSGPSPGIGDEPAADLDHHATEPAARHAGAPAARSPAAARSAAPRAARSSASPCPVRAASGNTGSRRRRPMATTRFEARARRPRAGRSCSRRRSAGRAASSGEYAASSAWIVCQSSSGSRPVAGSRSSRWTSSRVRSSVPQEPDARAPCPRPRPGSARAVGDDEARAPRRRRTMPSVGTRVVNG